MQVKLFLLQYTTCLHVGGLDRLILARSGDPLLRGFLIARGTLPGFEGIEAKPLVRLLDPDLLLCSCFSATTRCLAAASWYRTYSNSFCCN